MAELKTNDYCDPRRKQTSFFSPFEVSLLRVVVCSCLTQNEEWTKFSVRGRCMKLQACTY